MRQFSLKFPPNDKSPDYWKRLNSQVGKAIEYLFTHKTELSKMAVGRFMWKVIEIDLNQSSIAFGNGDYKQARLIATMARVLIYTSKPLETCPYWSDLYNLIIPLSSMRFDKFGFDSTGKAFYYKKPVKGPNIKRAKPITYLTGA